MTHNVAEARRLHAAIKDICAHHTGDAPDFRAFSRVLALLQAARDAVDDAYCHEKLRLAGEYAAEMLARAEHARWGRDADSGLDFLRQQVLNALDLFASRLYSLELRSFRGRLPWVTRSGVAQA